MIPNKKPSLKTKPGKYFVARQKGKSKTEAKVEAGYALSTPASQIEKSDAFQQIEKSFYKDALLEKVTLSELAEELLKNIRQDSDRGAKNTAIKIALDKIEPEDSQGDEPDKVLVILKS